MNQPLTINERYRLQFAAKSEGRSLENPSTSLSNPAQWLFDIWSNPTQSGVKVNDESALTLAAVYACNRVLCNAVASLSVHLFEELENGDLQRVRGQEDDLIALYPSDLYGSYVFRQTMQLHLGMRGNAYARIIRRGGIAVELRILQPDRVKPYIVKDKLYYKYTPADGDVEILMPYEVIHLMALSTNGIEGRSPIQAMAESIGLGLASRNYANKIYKKDGRLDGIIKHPGKLDVEGAKLISQTFNQAYTGENFGRIPVLERGMEFQEISIKPEESAFLASGKVSRLDVCSAYGVPPHMIGDLERSTNNNIEHQSLEFVRDTLRPLAKMWEDELHRKLVPLSQRSTRYYRFNLDSQLRADLNSRYRSYALGRQWGMLSVNDIRRLENLNSIGPEGDVYLTPMNMQDADTLLNGDPNSDQSQPLQNGNSA